MRPAPAPNASRAAMRPASMPPMRSRPMSTQGVANQSRRSPSYLWFLLCKALGRAEAAKPRNQLLKQELKQASSQVRAPRNPRPKVFTNTGPNLAARCKTHASWCLLTLAPTWERAAKPHASWCLLTRRQRAPPRRVAGPGTAAPSARPTAATAAAPPAAHTLAPAPSSRPARPARAAACPAHRAAAFRRIAGEVVTARNQRSLHRGMCCPASPHASRESQAIHRPDTPSRVHAALLHRNLCALSPWSSMQMSTVAVDCLSSAL